MKTIMVALAILGVAGTAAAAEPEMVVLDYGDFGPQAAAVELLGMDGCAWAPPHDVQGLEACDVKVVVYRGMDEAAVAKVHPVVKTKLQDYRYVEWDKAVAYLDEWIAEDVVPMVTARMRRARAKLE